MKIYSINTEYGSFDIYEKPEERAMPIENQTTSIGQKAIALIGLTFLSLSILAVPTGIILASYDYFVYHKPTTISVLGAILSSIGFISSSCYLVIGFAEKHYEYLKS